MSEICKKMTGYPSIDKPWLKYYENIQSDTCVPSMSLYQYAYERNKDTLDNIAFDYFGRKISYGKFFDNVQKVAKCLINMGVEKGDIVTIMSMHTPETIYSIYALNYIGAIANMVYFTSSGNEVLETVKNTDSKALFILDIAVDKIRGLEKQINIPIIVLSINLSMPTLMKFVVGVKKKKTPYITYKQFIGKCNDSELIYDSNPSAVAVIVYTSGTTGEPKGVMLTNSNINSLVFQYDYTDFKFCKKETFLDFLPPFVGYGIGMMAIAICNGLESYICLDPDAKKVADMFWKIHPNHIEVGKAHALQIINTAKQNVDMSYVMNFASGGFELSIDEECEISKKLKEHNSSSRFVFGYGMTECASSVCTNSNNVYKEGSIGIPLPLSVIKVMDIESQKECSYGDKGELWINSPNVMCGYFKNEAATNESLVADENGMIWLRTGDIGYIDEDGFVFFAGRLKRIYLVKGSDNNIYKLFPQRIEELIAKHPNVSMCGTIVLPSEDEYHISIAYITLINDELETQTLTELEESVKENLPEHARPKSIIVIKDMPITPTGKINYKQLEVEYANI